MNDLAVVAMADVLRHRLAVQLHFDATARTSDIGNCHKIKPYHLTFSCASRKYKPSKRRCHQTPLDFSWLPVKVYA